MQCPKCDYECIETQVAVICPNCDFIRMKKLDWKGESTKCPRCDKNARVFKHKKAGKSFICDHCNTVGRFLDESFNTKIIKKESDTGRRLTWLFDVPCEHWRKKDKYEEKYCKHCEIKDVCDAHLEEIDRMTKKQGVEVYIHDDYIEIVHK